MIETEHGLFTEVRTPSGELIMTAEEYYEYWKNKQIDICEDKPKTLEELTKENEQLWETVQLLLKKTGMIGDEASET